MYLLVYKQLTLPPQANHQVLQKKVNGYHIKGDSKYVVFMWTKVHFRV